MENLSLSDLYNMRDQISFELVEATPKEGRKLGKQLEDIENWIILKEVEKDGE
jgi:hypothetical protein